MAIVGQQHAVLPDSETDLDTTYDVLDEPLPSARYDTPTKTSSPAVEMMKNGTNINEGQSQIGKTHYGSQRKVTEWMQQNDDEKTEVCYFWILFTVNFWIKGSIYVYSDNHKTKYHNVKNHNSVCVSKILSTNEQLILRVQ